jgi:hypothetical protein
MNNDEIKLELAKHGMGWSETENRIYANETFTYRENGILKAGCMLTDVTGFSALELKIWFGY